MEGIKFNNGFIVLPFKNKFVILNRFGILHPANFDAQSDAVAFIKEVYNTKQLTN